ncbi:hypothetical protein D3C83_150770 [compost metagenome]
MTIFGLLIVDWGFGIWDLGFGIGDWGFGIPPHHSLEYGPQKSEFSSTIDPW